MSSPVPRTTPYSEYVFSNLPPTVESGGGLYNYAELAQLVGLKPTGNFRKRVQQLVKSGRLKSVPVFTPRGGIEVRFTSLPNEVTEIPF